MADERGGVAFGFGNNWIWIIVIIIIFIILCPGIFGGFGGYDCKE